MRPFSVYGLYILIAAVLVALGLIQQRAAHFFFDGIAIRDSGTKLGYLLSIRPIDSIYQIISHIEGPLQLLFLNVYAYTVGLVLPLSPSVMQFPNTIFIFLTSIILSLIGQRLAKPGSGFLFAVCLVLSPWVAICLRLPWYFNTLSVLLQALTLYFLIHYLDDNPPGVSKLLAPLSLALYMTTGLDWPIFFSFLGIFFILAETEHKKKILFNIYNVFPLFMVVYHLAVPLINFVYYGGWPRTKLTMLVYPFVKGSQGATWPSWESMFTNSLSGIGPQLLLAFVFIIFSIVKMRDRPASRGIQSSVVIAVCCWFCLSAFGVLKTSASIQYVYVMAVPTVILSGMLLAHFGRFLQWTCIAGMIGALVLVLGVPPHASTFVAPQSDDRHVLATAGFILEEYPELLTKEKTVLVPRERPACVAQYLRGWQTRIVMPANFPAEKYLHSVASPLNVLRAFVESYEKDGQILADWLILDSDLFADENPSREFFIKMKNDENICWLGRFSQEDGNTLFVGRVCTDRSGSIGEAPEIDIAKYAEIYSRKYDKISFLQRNIDKIDHY